MANFTRLQEECGVMSLVLAKYKGILAAISREDGPTDPHRTLGGGVKNKKRPYFLITVDFFWGGLHRHIYMICIYIYIFDICILYGVV